jgi:preprotein translocase subunit YajC
VISTDALIALLAQDDSGGGSSGAILQFGILLLIPAAMYFLMIRPQRRRAKEQRDLQTALKIDDEVITTSGIYGRITGEDGTDRFWLEIDDDVQIRVARAAIQGRVSDSGDSDTDDDADDDSILELEGGEELDDAESTD